MLSIEFKAIFGKLQNLNLYHFLKYLIYGEFKKWKSPERGKITQVSRFILFKLILTLYFINKTKKEQKWTKKPKNKRKIAPFAEADSNTKPTIAKKQPLLRTNAANSLSALIVRNKFAIN